MASMSLLTGGKIVRLILVFAIAATVIFVAQNAPALFASIRYSIDSQETVERNRMPLVGPVLLPVATTTPYLLPNTATLYIEKIGLEVPIVFGINENDFDAMYNRLNEGVVHFSDTPKPGEKGVAIIIGHSSDYVWKKNPYGTAFALLSRLKPGDKFTIRYAGGATFLFTMRQSMVYDPKKDDESKLKSLEDISGASVLLMTCWPINSTSQRFIVQGVMG